ncbi:MAG: FAD-dependent oxidoreductase [Pseudomonadota bacterium]
MLTSQTTDRRALLAGAGALLGGLALQGCTTTASRAMSSSLGCRLHPVDVRRERHIRTLVGLRPFRASGFVVRAEAFGDKRLVHNYGHGGGGITLSWGSSRLALDAGLRAHSGPVAVIGAGIMGLTTARLLQEAGYLVRIYTAQLPPHTTSNIAGGQWYPSLVYRRSALTPAFERQLVAAAAYSYRRFQIMIGDRYGVRWMRNYELSQRAPSPGNTDRLIASMMPEARAIEPDAHPFAAPFVRQYDGMIVETPTFLRQMLDDIRLAGGEIAIRSFRNPADLMALPETLIFNCTGLGAKALFGDEELVPMRGQLEILLPQPEVDYAVSAPGGIYMFSRRDGIILGGTADRGEWSMEPSETAADRIFTRHRQLFDAFRCAPPA